MWNKGLNRDVSPINQPEGSYRDARNIVYSKEYGSIVNEDGLYELPFDLPAQPIGIIPLNSDAFIVFMVSIDGLEATHYDEIGLVSNSAYTRILKATSADRLDFNVSNPIKGRFRVSNRGDRIIVWNDNLNPTRILNIDTLPFAVDGDKIPTVAGSIETLNLFSAGDPPQITYSLDTGGFLLSGTYFITTSYTLTDGTELNYSTVAGPVKINDDTSGTFTYDGCPAGTATSRSINLTFDEVDTRYSFLNIGIISIIGGETTFYKVGQIALTSGTTSYSFVYVGNEPTEELLLEQVTSNTSGLYNRAKALAVLNDQLVLGNLGAREHFDYQSYANDITIEWAIDREYTVNSHDSIKRVANLNEDGFRAFEVYAFYIAFRYKDGSYSPAYHIPGRVSSGTDLDPSTLLVGALKFQVEDTCATDGTMSYWQNEGEVYPSDFPDFANQNVRHHKFPSLNFLMTNAATLGYSGWTTRMGGDVMPVLTFNASNVIIPAELEEQIDGWQIFHAKRDINNMTCVGQGHLIFSHQNINNTSNLSPNTDVFNGLVNAIFDSDRGPLLTKVSFHSPDLLLNKPSIAPSYVRNEIQLSVNVNTAYASVDSDADPIVENAASNKLYKLVNYLYTGSDRTCTATASADLIRVVASGASLYIAPNAIDGSYYNIQSSEYVALDITDGDTLTIAPDLDIITNPTTCNNMEPLSAIGRRKEDTYLSNLCQLISTVYSPFVSQTLVATTNVIDPSETDTTGSSTIKIGDSYTADYSFVSTGFVEDTPLDDTTDIEPDIDLLAEGWKIIRHYVCECNINIRFRHEGTDNNSKYYGKTDYKISTSSELENSFLTDWDITREQVIEYNSDYSAQNTFNPVFPKNTVLEPLTTFPFRVIISERTSNELTDSGWRTFLANNYKDVVSIKGEISNLEVYDDILLIHVEDTLFRTIGSQRLKTSTEDVTIGVGDIFEHDPKEILSSEMGYLGNQNLIGCGVNKLGYTFFDASQGKLFAVGANVKELSAQGLKNDIRDNFKSDPVADNPFTVTGVSIAYDEKYNRLLVCKKGTDSFTLSYSLDQEGFTAYHDYTPDLIFNTRHKMFSITGTKVYEHNYTTKATYYDGTVYPSYIEPIIKAPEKVMFGSLRWNSEVRNSVDTSLFHKTFTKILVYNSYQCSGEITLTYPDNIFNAETTWNFNNFYDIVKDRSLPFFDSNGLILSNLSSSMAWFKQRKFVDRWIACRLIYNNTDQNTLLLYDVSALMRKSAR